MIDVPGSNDNTTVASSQAPNSTNAGDSNVASPRASFAHGQRDRQHAEAAEHRIGRQLVAGADVADLHVAEAFKRMQRYPAQQQRSDEGRAADDIHHLLALDPGGQLTDFGCVDELAHETIFEAL